LRTEKTQGIKERPIKLVKKEGGNNTRSIPSGKCRGVKKYDKLAPKRTNLNWEEKA